MALPPLPGLPPFGGAGGTYDHSEPAPSTGYVGCQFSKERFWSALERVLKPSLPSCYITTRAEITVEDLEAVEHEREGELLNGAVVNQALRTAFEYPLEVFELPGRENVFGVGLPVTCLDSQVRFDVLMETRLEFETCYRRHALLKSILMGETSFFLPTN